MRVLLPSVALSALALAAAAQVPCGVSGVTVTVSPQTAALGKRVRVLVTNNSDQQINLPSLAVYTEVFGGASCTPPVVFTPIYPQAIYEIPPGESTYWMPWFQNDDDGQQVPAGVYSFRIPYWDANFTTLSSCCATVTLAEGVPVPAIPSWGIGLLIALVAAAGAWTVRRQARAG